MSEPAPPAADRLAAPADGLVHLAVSVLLLSSAWPFAKLAVQRGMSALWFAEGRAALSALAAWTWLALLGRVRAPRRADGPALLAVGVCQLAAFFLFTHLAVAWVPAGRTSVLANTTTIFVVPLSLVLLHEPIPLRRWLAAGLGLAGVAVLTGPWSIDWSDHRVVVGHALLLAAGLSWAIAIIVVRRYPPRLSMLALLPWSFSLATLLLLPVLLWRGAGGGLGPDPSAWTTLLYVGLIAGPIGTWSVLQASARLPTVVASVGFLATPATGLVLSNLVLGEPITPDLLLGTALILAGVGAAAWPARRRS